MIDAKNVKVSEKLLGIAAKAFANFAKADAALGKSRDKLSSFVFEIAKEACAEAVETKGKDAGVNFELASILFDKAAKAVQSAYQKEHKDNDSIVPMVLLVPSWPPIKSQMLSNLRNACDPREYDSLSEMTKDRLAKVKEAGRGKVDSDTKGDGEDSETVELPKGITEAVARLHKAIGAVSSLGKQHEGAIVAAINKLSADFETMYLGTGESDGESPADLTGTEG